MTGWQDLNRIGVRLRPLTVAPHERTRNRRRSPFSASLWTTISDLGRELRALNARRPILEIDIAEGQFRLDGWPRADARLGDPCVALSFDARDLGQLRYVADRYNRWEDNLRGLALGLESLRAVDRYGITKHGEQYAGWKALGSGIPMGPATMTPEEAAQLLVDLGEWGGAPGDPETLLDDGPIADEIRRDYFRQAAKRYHPDAGGDPDTWARIEAARRTLEGLPR